jgi:hypothetical protein
VMIACFPARFRLIINNTPFYSRPSVSTNAFNLDSV